MIGRNDTCICGSGKKYKKCCHLKNGDWTSEIDSLNCEPSIKNVIKSTYDFIRIHDFQGGCHLISAIHQILFSELGYKTVVKIGEVRVDKLIFDHSWIEYEGKVIDIAIMNTLQNSIKLPPVVLGVSVGTGNPTPYQYGVSEKLDFTAQAIYKQSIGNYIQGGVHHGALGIMTEIADRAGVQLDNIDNVLAKYMNVYRVLVTEFM